jgi:hypothetical protein
LGGGWFRNYVEIRNVTDATRGVRLGLLPSGAPPAGTPPLAGAVPLKYAIVSGTSEAQGRVYQTLPATFTTQLTAGASVRLALLPDAVALAVGNTNSAFQSILEVADDASGMGLVRQRFGVRAMARLGSAQESRGLWVGEVNIHGRRPVAHAWCVWYSPNTAAGGAARSPFRLLAHVDSNGVARLLQRVFVGTRADPVNGGIVTDLFSTEAPLSNYRSQYPDAKLFRLSSANFPFMSPTVLSMALLAWRTRQ